MSIEKTEPAVPEKGSTCPLPLPPEERKKMVDEWLEGIPAGIRAKVERLKVIEVGVGMGPACVGVYIRKLKNPGRPLLIALDWLAGHADLMRRCHVVMTDGQMLYFEPHRFLLHRAAPTPRPKKKQASSPEVGIFWIDDLGRMFAASASLRKAEDYGEFKVFEKGHLELWDAAIRANPKWRHLEYEEVPRGRVVFRKNQEKPEFIVYMPKRIGKYRTKVIGRFNLPSGHIRFDFDDEHYQMNDNNRKQGNKP